MPTSAREAPRLGEANSAIELPEHEFSEWLKRLQRRVECLQRHFNLEVTDNQFFKKIAVNNEEGAPTLQPIQNGLDLLCAVQSLMELAGHMPASISSKALGALQNLTIEPTQSSPVHPVYGCQRLHDTTSRIRLAYLQPGDDDDGIRIDLACVDDMHNCLYEAVSYVWGDSTDEITISVNQANFNISVNLGATLQCLRHKDRSRALWIDALCINQADNDEKSAQVRLMGQIYRSAAQVVIFLGEEANDSNLVMQYLDLESTDDVKTDLITTKETAAEREAAVEALIQRTGLDRLQLLRAAEIFFRRPWWTRMWVVQEYALAGSPPLWYCGRASTSTANVKSRLAQLFSYITDQAMPINGDPAVANYLLQGSAEDAWLEMFSRRWNVSRMLRVPWDISLHPAQGVVRTLFRQCADARDKVFAMRDIWDPISREIFPPDYSTTWPRLYPSMTAYLLLTDEWGELYGNIQLISGSTDTPSWAVDFTRPFTTTVSGLMLATERDGKTTWMQRKGQMSMYRNILGVSGVELDIVDYVFAIDNTVDDLALLEQIWRVSVALIKLKPSMPLPEVAEKCFPPGCQVPFKSVWAMQNEFTVLKNAFPVAIDLPGYARCVMESQRAVLSTQPPQWQPENLKCDSWRHNSSLSIWREVYSRYGHVMISATKVSEPETDQDDDSFLAGAVWDLENLKAQIQTVRLIGDDDSEPELNSAPSPDYHTIPQYPRICRAIAQAKSEMELSRLKQVVMDLAHAYRQIVELYHKTPSDKHMPSTPDMLDGISSSNRAHLSKNIPAWQTLHDLCTCENDDHRRLLKQLISRSQMAIRKEAEARERELPARVMGSYDYTPGLAAAMKRQFKCFFVTKRGFLGVSYQDHHGIEKGDKVLLLDGIPCAMVACSAGEADKRVCRMKAAAVIVGVEKFDLDSLVELDLCQRREWRFV